MHRKTLEILVINEEEPKSRGRRLLQDFISNVTSFVVVFMDVNVNLKRNELLRKLKIMSNNKIYRAYEIGSTEGSGNQRMIFLQGKLLEILTNTYY